MSSLVPRKGSSLGKDREVGEKKEKMSSHMQGERNADREGGEWERGRGPKCLDYVVKSFRGESQPRPWTGNFKKDCWENLEAMSDLVG